MDGWMDERVRCCLRCLLVLRSRCSRSESKTWSSPISSKVVLMHRVSNALCTDVRVAWCTLVVIKLGFKRQRLGNAQIGPCLQVCKRSCSLRGDVLAVMLDLLCQLSPVESRCGGLGEGACRSHRSLTELK
jgi:hypothetical protein